MSSDGKQGKSGFSRRGVLLAATLGPATTLAPALARAATGSAPGAAASPGGGEDSIDLSPHVPFYGTGGQAGIQTPPQRHIMYMTLDLTTKSASDLQVLLALWSGAIARMMAGQPAGMVESHHASAVGVDSGEALNLDPASLTVTVGLGPRVFGPTFGLERHRPPLMRELRQLPSDAFDPALTGGDLSLQACADDPQVAYHAIRNLVRIAKDTGTAATRWTVMGFGRASAGPGQTTPRNLLGFKDGTRNVSSEEDFRRFVWISDGPSWQRNGTYQVARKILMHLETWDTDRVDDQNAIFGRHKVSGAPLSGEKEFDTPLFDRKAADGSPVIPDTAHIRLAAHENNGGIKILRRSYNYTDGINRFGFLDAGLLFISYQKDPEHFERIQSRLGASDALNEYISHIGSAIFFVPPAPRPGEHIGQYLFT